MPLSGVGLVLAGKYGNLLHNIVERKCFWLTPNCHKWRSDAVNDFAGKFCPDKFPSAERYPEAFKTGRDPVYRVQRRLIARGRSLKDAEKDLSRHYVLVTAQKHGCADRPSMAFGRDKSGPYQQFRRFSQACSDNLTKFVSGIVNRVPTEI
ncbi:hypothetical protein KSD_10090 [Ktedonobacter sp. SOSP1-85]|nr:hypothetical protein KSD_10090 [Ktedonobacter sp. SOSP1-85]